MSSYDVNLLLVDDDDVAAEAVTRSLRKHGVATEPVWAQNGAIALQVLRGEHPQLRVPEPRIILLDLNMPYMNGFEFLQALRADPRLQSSVVFVLTTSDAEADRTRAYHENIAGYMVKAAVGPQFAKLARLLSEYRSSVRLPQES